jgi:dihydrofolate reductase
VSIGWAPYDARLYGYDSFLREVGALIMGRRTFELISGLS